MLPSNFKPKQNYDLMRLGRRYDGGYLVEKNSVQQADILIAMGISTDWSFEKDFLTIKPVPVQAYDHTVTSKFWFKFLKKNLLDGISSLNISKMADCIKLYKDYKTFFSGNVLHIKKMIGLKSQRGVSVSDIMQEIASDKIIFFKIDIEGSEYRILDELVKYAPQISGLAIEFHDIDLHREKIGHFIQKFPLTLIHTHANNYGLADDKGDPLVIEMSFADEPRLTEPHQTWQYPHPLDDVNNPRQENIDLSFDSSAKV